MRIQKAGFVYTDAQRKSLQIADLTIEDGRLRIDTQTGGFSKGGLVSTITIRGNFDVQVDFKIDFVAGKLDMDQLLGFAVVARTPSGRPIRLFTK